MACFSMKCLFAGVFYNFLLNIMIDDSIWFMIQNIGFAIHDLDCNLTTLFQKAEVLKEKNG